MQFKKINCQFLQVQVLKISYLKVWVSLPVVVVTVGRLPNRYIMTYGCFPHCLQVVSNLKVGFIFNIYFSHTKLIYIKLKKSNLNSNYLTVILVNSPPHRHTHTDSESLMSDINNQLVQPKYFSSGHAEISLT